MRYVGILLCCLLLPACSMPANIIMPTTIQDVKPKCDNPNPIIRAFVLNGFDEDEIASQLKEFGNQDIDKFMSWLIREPSPKELNGGWLYSMSGGRKLEELFKKVKIDYNYYRDKNGKD